MTTDERSRSGVNNTCSSALKAEAGVDNAESKVPAGWWILLLLLLYTLLVVKFTISLHTITGFM
jgi:hypothetical protein